MSSAGVLVAKKKPVNESRQIAVRYPTDLADTLEEAAKALGLDVSSLLRMMAKENVGKYLARGKEAAEQAREPRK